MSANDKRGARKGKDQEMAADLKRRGIFHGVRQSKTNAPCVPNMGDTGSAAYRRLHKR